MLPLTNTTSPSVCLPKASFCIITVDIAGKKNIPHVIQEQMGLHKKDLVLTLGVRADVLGNGCQKKHSVAK